MRIKTGYGRGGVVSGVSFSNIRLPSLGSVAGTAITVDEYDGNILPNASHAPDGWPTIANISFTDVTGGAVKAGTFRCIPERPCVGLKMRNVTITHLEGFDCSNAFGTTTPPVSPASCLAPGSANQRQPWANTQPRSTLSPPPPVTPPAGYECHAMSDITGRSCDLPQKAARSAWPNLTALALACDAELGAGCRGFNTNGYLKRCVRASCGAQIRRENHGVALVACLRADTPANQTIPAGCAGPSPGPKPPPRPPPPGPRPPPPPQPAFNCTVTAYRSECNCFGVPPPFPAPAKPPPTQNDYHYPEEEPAELQALETDLPWLRNATSSVAYLGFRTGTNLELELDAADKNGWTLCDVNVAAPVAAVVKRIFDGWSMLIYLRVGALQPERLIRMPIGRLAAIQQPEYDFNAEYECKQDVDPTDFLATVASNISVRFACYSCTRCDMPLIDPSTYRVFGACAHHVCSNAGGQ